MEIFVDIRRFLIFNIVVVSRVGDMNMNFCNFYVNFILMMVLMMGDEILFREVRLVFFMVLVCYMYVM